MLLKAWSVDQFIANEVPTPTFLLEPILPAGGMGLVFGAPGHGKTQFCFTIARCLCDGEPLFGRFPALQTSVTYIGIDMPVRMLQERCRAFAREFQHPERLQIVPSDQRFNVMALEERDAKIIRDHKPGLVIVDTLRKCHELDEDRSSTVAMVSAAWRRLLGPEPTVLFLHHNRKISVEDDLTDPDRVMMLGRGSIAWTADTDLTVYCRKRRTVQGMIFEVNFPRFRYSEEEPSVLCRMNPVSHLLEALDPQTPAVEPEPKPKKAKPPAVPAVDRKTVVEALAQEHPEWGQAEMVQALQDRGWSQTTAYRYANQKYGNS